MGSSDKKVEAIAAASLNHDGATRTLVIRQMYCSMYQRNIGNFHSKVWLKILMKTRLMPLNIQFFQMGGVTSVICMLVSWRLIAIASSLCNHHTVMPTRKDL
jgi:hypothetical protein